jgi:hypothetical protein
MDFHPQVYIQTGFHRRVSVPVDEFPVSDANSAISLNPESRNLILLMTFRDAFHSMFC